MFLFERIYQISNHKESSSQKPNMSRQNDITSSKQNEVKITMEREIGLKLHSYYNCSSKTHLSPQCQKITRSNCLIINSFL